tara:strand:- start:666 stop:1742 length:1077 start_codon:yes stop_codon:yes gene_type:complete
MTGKIKLLNSNSLFFLISFSLLINSYLFQNLKFLGTFLLFFLISFLTTKYGLKIIKRLNLLQNIRKEGPSSHLNKTNTPTIGGLFIIIPFLIFLLTASINFSSVKLLLLMITILGFFAIGFLDDYLSIINKQNTGLRSYEKFIMQSLISIFFILLSLQKDFISSTILISDSWLIDAKFFIIPLSFLTIVGLCNAVNLTDGLDGLASGCSSIVFFGLGTEIILKGEQELIIYSFLCYAMSGLCLGFLKFNKYPAKIFMGDTGSLSIGAILGCISIYTNSFLSLFIFSGIFILEAFSVMVQVTFFKVTKKIFKKGKRIFLMTPIHHHFELKGIKEEKIVENFWKINTLLVFLGIVLKINY